MDATKQVTVPIANDREEFLSKFVLFVLSDKMFCGFKDYPGFGHFYDAMHRIIGRGAFRGMQYAEFSNAGISLSIGSPTMQRIADLASFYWLQRKQGIR